MAQFDKVHAVAKGFRNISEEPVMPEKPVLPSKASGMTCPQCGCALDLQAVAKPGQSSTTAEPPIAPTEGL
jgi:hypothetical protein